MRTDDVALVLRCAECGAPWHPTDRERWRAYLGVDEHLDEPAEVVFYCPTCALEHFENT